MKNVCPNCLQVTISLGEEEEIKCPVCGSIFDPKEDEKEDA